MTHGLDSSFLVAAEVSCHADHVAARTLASSLRQQEDHFALAPQVLAEFVHIVTDPKRFTAPLTMPFRSANITSLLTLNAADFAVFGEFTCVPLAAPIAPA